MIKKFAPLIDDVENNPDAKYIVGEYSKFDAEFARNIKEIKKQYKTLKNIKKNAIASAKDHKTKQELSDFFGKKQLAFKKAAQKLATSKMLNSGTITQYMIKTRNNIMSTILNNDMLLSDALNFCDLYPFQKDAFLQLLNKKLSDLYGIQWGNAFMNNYGDTGNAAYKPESRDDYSSIRIDGIPETLDEFIKLFAHEFSHKLTSEKPDTTPFGAQAAKAAKDFYISSKEDLDGYETNADELLSYSIEQAVSKNFESDLRLLASANMKSYHMEK